jgi:cytochrome c-type biogenesis protein
MLASILDGSRVTLPIAYTAGLASFFSGCFLPLLPLYVAYITPGNRVVADSHQSNSDNAISGANIAHEVKAQRPAKKKVAVPGAVPALRPAVLAVAAGFILVFLLLGVSAGWIGRLTVEYEKSIREAVGFLFIVVGLRAAGLSSRESFPINPPHFRGPTNRLFWWPADQRLRQMFRRPLSRFTPFMMGVALALLWTPCIGPVLGVILYLAGTRESVWEGGLLLMAYGTGLMTPLILFAQITEHFPAWRWKKAQATAPYLRIIGGCIVVTYGIILLSGRFSWLARVAVTAL